MSLVGQTLKGSTKSIRVEEDAVVISYRALYHGFKGDKRIPFSSITAVEFKEPGSWLAGFIQFSILGGVEWRGAVNQDENALQYEKADAEAFRSLRDFIQARIGRQTTHAPASVADEITKLAALRDNGILSPEEFESQKGKLLR